MKIFFIKNDIEGTALLDSVPKQKAENIEEKEKGGFYQLLLQQTHQNELKTNHIEKQNHQNQNKQQETQKALSETEKETEENQKKQNRKKTIHEPNELKEKTIQDYLSEAKDNSIPKNNHKNEKEKIEKKLDFIPIERTEKKLQNQKEQKSQQIEEIKKNEPSTEGKIFEKEQNVFGIRASLLNDEFKIKISASVDFQKKELEHQEKQIKENTLWQLLSLHKEKKETKQEKLTTKELIDEMSKKEMLVSERQEKSNPRKPIESNEITSAQKDNNQLNVWSKENSILSDKIQITTKPKELETKTLPKEEIRDKFYAEKNPQQSEILTNPKSEIRDVIDKKFVSLDQSLKEALEELISKAKVQVGKNEFTAQIRMNPAIFGYMSVNIKYENGHLVLRLLVDNQAVFQKLNDSVEMLKNEFQKHGIYLEQIQIRMKEPMLSNSNMQDSMNLFYDTQENFQSPSHHNPYLGDHERERFSYQKENFQSNQELKIQKNKEERTEDYNLMTLNTHHNIELWG
ncbi:MAG: flagellar hook-length control protein FliK [Leptospiraceae bacterium]|nr:flagellar hook-length control protein FliK [Leptospiraceae bacterium]MDW7975624.1 flagellar hook-length control protein FliK [Leptospiraceae bacterium]